MSDTEFDRTLKAAWRELRNLGVPSFQVTPEKHGGATVQSVADRWHRAFSDVPGEVLIEACREYVADEIAWQTEDWTQEGIYVPWPVTADVARHIPVECFAKPDPHRWRPPTGCDLSATEWLVERTIEETRKLHLKAGCWSAWMPTARMLDLEYRWTRGLLLNRSWPDPLRVAPRDTSCGIWCVVASTMWTQEEFAEPVQGVRDFERGVTDPVTLIRRYQQWDRKVSIEEKMK